MRKKIIMVYPLQGFSSTFVMHAPISLLYASSEIVKAGYEVQILDARLHPHTWKRKLESMMTDETLLVGISVMSGKPIKHASEISAVVKSKDPNVHVVWGGPHATFQPDSILAYEPNCDFVVSGYGSYPFKLLVDSLVEGRLPTDVGGVSYRDLQGNVQKNPKTESFENIPYNEIPYDLVPDYTVYGHIGEKRLIFSMYSVLGCPYQCSFCSSPAQYRNIPGKKWVPLTVNDVADHVEYVVKKYKANFIYFIDDDSFVKLEHVEGLIDEINRRKLDVKLGFRGARISEIKHMTDEFLTKLAAAGTNIMHVGVESGSNRILSLIRKNCTVDDIVACNQKLARHPEIMAGYNIMMGVPTETMEELMKTRDLILKLVNDHPNCIIFSPNKFRPLPDTELFQIAVRDWGYTEPKTLEDWSNIEVEGDYTAPWLTQQMKKFCDLMLVGSYFVDRKAIKVAKGNSMVEKAVRFLDYLYGPIARFRFRKGLWQGLVEYQIYGFCQTIGRHIGTVLGMSKPQQAPAEATNC